MGTRSLSFLVVLTLLATSSCGKGERPLDPTLLWVPPHAKIMWAPHMARGDCSCELGFTLVDVDREELTQQLIQHFEKIGWRQRSANHRTGHPTSFREGWEAFREGGVITLDTQGRILDPGSHFWHGEWENERGEVIVYDLDEARDENARRGMRGYAMYTRH
jgi:hypothetical protein